nr:MAG TPA: Terminase large subunit [Crassvirales sp.]
MENIKVLIQTNRYQTPVTQELLDSLPSEVAEQLMDCLTSIQFIKNLISPDRLYYKDLPRDERGAAIVDITNPPILEDADYFRQAALHYQKHGCYTFLKPNSNPNSEFRKFWDEERRRCWEGFIRPSDGAWISGFNYWFLNYQPMMVNKITEGRKKAVRVEAFPFVQEGNIWRYYYLFDAREQGHHAIELAKRGCAKSYSLATIMGHNLILGESEESRRRVITVLTAYQKEYLSDNKDGTLSKFKPAINFSFSHTPFPHLMLKNSPNEMSWQMGYKDEYGIERGSLNQVLAVSAKDDSEKLRGKRGWILFEEMGSFKGLLSLYDITRKSVEDGDYTFATMYLVGTTAEDESDFSSAKTLLYYPEAYNILSVENVYDRPKQGKPTFGYFFPSYINRAGCYNKDGVSDVVKALIEILMQRHKAKYSADPKSVLRVIAEDPITPAEAIIKVKAAFFPVTALTERLQQLDTDVHSFDDVYIGKLVMNKSGEVEFKPTSDEPIRKYGVENDTPGAIEIFELPEKDRSGKVPDTRYIIGHDPVDNDQAESSSLSSTFVLDLWTDKIVAEYTGRQSFAEDNFEIVRLLCLFYNAKCLYESNKKGIYAYFAKMNCTHRLADTPEYLRDKQMIKYSSFGSNQKGVNATAAINNYANGLIRDWLMKPVTMITTIDGVEREVTTQNLFFLRNRALIEELIAFNPEINVDRIRALGMVMLYREEKMVLYQGNPSRDKDVTPKDYIGNDPFFTNNYDKKFKKPVNLVKDVATS